MRFAPLVILVANGLTAWACGGGSSSPTGPAESEPSTAGQPIVVSQQTVNVPPPTAVATNYLIVVQGVPAGAVEAMIDWTVQNQDVRLYVTNRECPGGLVDGQFYNSACTVVASTETGPKPRRAVFENDRTQSLAFWISNFGPGAAAVTLTVSVSASQAAPTPTPGAGAGIVINSFSVTHTSGTVRASQLGWSLDLNLTQGFPGLFVRVELRFGPAGGTNACYASELTQPEALSPQPHLQIGSTGFARAPRTSPGLSCNWGAFQPTFANVRVFGAADAYAQTPVAVGDFPVPPLTVTE
jgi:hypothetical protein